MKYRLNAMSTHHALMQTVIVEDEKPASVARDILRSRPRGVRYIDVYEIPHDNTYGKFIGSFSRNGWQDAEHSPIATRGRASFQEMPSTISDH